MKTSIILYIGIFFIFLFLSSCQKENLDEIFTKQKNEGMQTCAEEAAHAVQSRKGNRNYNQSKRSNNRPKIRPGDIIEMKDFGNR
jgi:hypothetical protein